MKRVLVLVLVLAFSVTMFAMPASASELDDSTWINVFDYVEDNHLYYAEGDVCVDVFLISLPDPLAVYSFDMVVHDVGGVLAGSGDSFSFQFAGVVCFDVKYIYLGDNLYRIYGYEYSGDQDSIVTDELYFQILIDSAIAGYFDILSLYVNIAPNTTFDIECYCDILAYAYGNSIHYVPTDDINHREWLASDEAVDPFLQLDLFSEDWQKYDYIDFILNVQCFSITSITAFRDGVQLPVSYSMTDNSSSGSKSFTILIRLDLRGLDRTNSSLPIIHIEGQMLPSEYNLVGVLSCVGGIITDNSNPFVVFFSQIRIGLTNISNSVNRLYQYISGDNSTADNTFAANVQTKDDELDVLIQDMNAVERPNIDSVQSDVSDLVSGNDIVLASQGLGSLINNDIIFSLFSMSLILCLASYVFFGKK